MSSETKITPQQTGRLLALVPLLVIRILTALAFKPNNGNLHWRQLIALRFLQSQRATLPQDILRWLIRRTSTGEGIRQYCAKHSIAHHEVTLQSAALGEHATITPPGILHFVTPSPPKKGSKNDDEDTFKRTVLYLHGGGYVNPMRAEAHMPLILKIASASRASQVAILEYSLAPEHPYPAQTIQAIAALKHLLDEMDIAPEDIILAGDSAGGQMVGSVLAHCVMPCPYAVSILLGSGKGRKFAGALLISPLTKLEIEDGSYDRNEGADYLDQRQMKGFEDAWKPTNGEVWADMCEGRDSKEVWDEVFGLETEGGGIVKKVMVVVGTAEVFLDSCQEFAERFMKIGKEAVVGVDRGVNIVYEVSWDEKGAVVYVECEGEVHVQAALDSAVGYEGGLMMGAIIGWLRSF